MRVVLLGGAGLVGRALARRLSRVGRVELVVLDLHPPGLPETRFARVDLLNTPLAPHFAGADVVVHLVAEVNPGRADERARLRRLHEEGTQLALEAACQAGVRRFVLCSSAVVYGARPGQSIPRMESHPRAPNRDFPYAVDKARQEELVEEHASRLETVIARPAIIYGQDAQNYLTELLRLAPGVLPAIDGRRPPLQFVHVDDVAEALAALASREVSGIFNICPPDWLAYDEVARMAGLRVLPVPRRWIAPVLDTAARWLPPDLRAPSYVLDYLSHPFVMSAAKLHRTLGILPMRTTADALHDMLRIRRRRWRPLPAR